MRTILLDLDTTRPDHLGCYGYSRNTSPNLDSIAAEGLRFDRYYCSDAPCLPSRAALVTGKFGIHSGIVDHGGNAADMRNPGPDRFMFNQNAVNNLFFQFRSAGMHTVSVSTFAERHSAYWFNAGFNETYNVGGVGSETADSVISVVNDWLERCGKKDNWFLHVHMWDPHAPYNAPVSFGEPFRDVPLEDPWIDDKTLEKHKKAVGPHTAQELGMFTDAVNPALPRNLGQLHTLEDVKHVIDEYDTGIRFMDYQIGLMLEKLKELGIYEDAIFIITSDHGENMGELGIYSEHATADECTCHIPLIIRWPGMHHGVDSGLHYNIDLTATLGELLGQPPLPEGDGQSFAETLRSGKDTGRDYLVISQLAHVCQRAVRFEDYLYIRTYHDGYHLFPTEQLYDVVNDPHEQNDLCAILPEKRDKAARLLLNWEAEQMLSSAWETDPMWTVIRGGGPFNATGQLPRYLKRLEETGRTEAAEALRQRHPKEAVKNKFIPQLPGAIRAAASGVRGAEKF